MEFKLDESVSKTRDIDRQLFDINTSFSRKLLEEANKKSLSKVKKGKALEKLAAYLFSGIEGFDVRTNQRTQDAQLDLIIRNSVKYDPIYDVLGKFILVECKNWFTEKVGVQEVKNFIANVHFSYCNCGILVTKRGITGSSKDVEKDKKDAELTILKEFHQDNIVIIVLTLKDLQAIVEGKSNLLSVLLDKYEAIKLDK
ncbi:MAG TPA: restriction endonuclease [Patescibacteria group bacterium]|nr:restriction endonuclease [Patescibacteria group bacterium]